MKYTLVERMRLSLIPIPNPKSFLMATHHSLLNTTLLLKLDNLFEFNYMISKKITEAITAVGGYVLEDKLTNFDLEKMVKHREWFARTELKGSI